ncbi:hypothetical protein A9B99_01100 [Mangrovibacter phragmitis]|uniref:Hemolysin n=1 Tax=Mangrovibacter phragmitis TaxID=1691903 RepID=A0A1B7L7Q0_9ENTR|nr:DUF333 domain-containing protein [Mangrovibacter phragmitis]OAT78363.1 hypothetical protein A9B99_01100 [Mangrovibacter phragmitis]
MKAGFIVAAGAALFFLTACSSNEPVQQATAAHTRSPLESVMSGQGQANCAMIGGMVLAARQLDGSMIGTCALPNGKRCNENALAAGNCGTY